MAGMRAGAAAGRQQRPMLEENLRRALVISRGDPSVFVTRPLSLGFIIATVLILVLVAAPAVRCHRAAIAG